MRIRGERRAKKNKWEENKEGLDELLTDFESEEGVTAGIGHLAGLFQSMFESTGDVVEAFDLPGVKKLIDRFDCHFNVNFCPPSTSLQMLYANLLFL